MNINVRDLRLGNIIRDTEHPERLCKVHRLSYGDFPITYKYGQAFESTPKHGKGLEGALIHEDWMDLHFERSAKWDAKIWSHPKLGNSQFLLYYNNINYLFKSKLLGEPLTSCKYIHQIQNIFRDFTGEDLEPLKVVPLPISGA